MSKYSITLFPGDGIGVEIAAGAQLILQKLKDTFHINFTVEEGLIGGASIDKYGKPLTQENLDLAKKSNAILLGAVGGPKWEGLDYSIRPERGLLGIRKELELHLNLYFRGQRHRPLQLSLLEKSLRPWRLSEQRGSYDLTDG